LKLKRDHLVAEDEELKQKLRELDQLDLRLEKDTRKITLVNQRDWLDDAEHISELFESVNNVGTDFWHQLADCVQGIVREREKMDD